MPCSAACRTLLASEALSSSALAGMQPHSTQVPPSASRSMTATVRPSWAQRMAHDVPGGTAAEDDDLGLPKKFATEANFVFVKSRILFGIAHLGPGLGDIEYSFDFTKNWRHADFLNWKRIPATEELRGGSGEIATTRNVIVPDNATRMVVRVKGASTLPSSSLTLPNGTTVTGTDAAKQIDYTVASGNVKAFWTVLEPSAGRWTINAPSAATGDVIEIFVDALPAPFTFTHTQQNRNVTLTWTPQGNVDDSIAFFVAGTGTTADGLDLGWRR